MARVVVTLSLAMIAARVGLLTGDPMLAAACLFHITTLPRKGQDHD